MPYAQILTSASKAATTGGTFADALTANSGDSLAVANFNTGGARVLEAWGIDSDAVAELSWVYTRPESTHDQQRGLRVMIPAIALGGAGVPAGFPLMSGMDVINLFKSDTATLNVSTTAADDVLVSYVIEYDDLPGASGDEVRGRAAMFNARLTSGVLQDVYCLTNVTGTEMTALPPSGASNCAA